MAVQARLYPENLGLSMSGFQSTWMVNPVAVSASEPDFGFCFQDPQHALFAQDNVGGYHANWGISASCSSSSTCDSLPSMALSHSSDVQLQMQKRELDCILQLQNERLRHAVQGQGKQQLAILLKHVESKAFYLMKQKEDDLARASKKTMELEACLRNTEMEIESWKRLARANEAMVVDLGKRLEQVKERLVVFNNTTEDAESCFSCHIEQQEQESEAESMAMACKKCNSGRSCMLFLPCRHLCSCKNCESFLGSCPVCNSVKEASMEVFWF